MKCHWLIAKKIKDTRLHVPVGTLSATDTQKISKRLRKGSEGSVHWNEYKTKSENKNTTNEYRYFLYYYYYYYFILFIESHFLEPTDYLF